MLNDIKTELGKGFKSYDYKDTFITWFATSNCCE